MDKLYELLMGINKRAEETNKWIYELSRCAEESYKHVEETTRQIRQDIAGTNNQAVKTNRRIDTLDEEVKRIG